MEKANTFAVQMKTIYMANMAHSKCLYVDTMIDIRIFDIQAIHQSGSMLLVYLWPMLQT